MKSFNYLRKWGIILKSNDTIRELTVKELLSNAQYVIPLYQRNFSWGQPEITQFMHDIMDCFEKNNRNYYIGTLVVLQRRAEKGVEYEVIDGQQRLTTLHIMLSALKKHPFYEHLANGAGEAAIDTWYRAVNLKFDCRQLSSDTLEDLFDKTTDLNCKESNAVIVEAYFLALKELNNRVPKDKFISFCKYLADRVIIFRTLVPKDTDLNHYFERMNSRGAQLEKHEIVKAKCLEILKDEKERSYAFDCIWEACSNISEYAQDGFKGSIRERLFGEKWNCKDFEGISNSINENRDDKDSASKGKTMDELMEEGPDTIDDKINSDTLKDGLFNTVINFPNFLLHVLKITASNLSDNIPLDDKRLLGIFEDLLEKTEDKVKFVKLFGYNLLKCKFLFDKYIIKETQNIDSWSLREYVYKDKSKGDYKNTFEEDNDEIGMLLSMFHVSFPAQGYKYWLFAALKYMFQEEEMIGEKYYTYLKKLAALFLYNRFLAEEPENYDELLCEGKELNTTIQLDKLDRGVNLENYILNYLDFLLWENNKAEYRDFKFTYKSSMEHYYPQNPMDGNEIPKNTIYNFGNICLIGRDQNSRLSNHSPRAKKDYYTKSLKNASIKQRMMMAEEEWDEAQIEKHGKTMKDLLCANLQEMKVILHEGSEGS